MQIKWAPVKFAETLCRLYFDTHKIWNNLSSINIFETIQGTD